MTKNDMATTVIKTVKDKKYLYFSYYETGEKREKYCGLASDKQSKKKALQFELEHLKEQKNNITQKIIEIEQKLKSK
jgi:hypothetical protein